MILRELFYFDRETVEPEIDKRYDPEEDFTPVKASDTRKTRLKLKQINRIRKASELNMEQRAEELNFVKQMYGIASNSEAAGV